MAENKFVKMLRFAKTAQAWNTWRKRHPGIIPSLKHASITKATLRKANFSAIDLTKADLSQTDLRYATLTDAVLTGSRAVAIRLSGANLQGARLDAAVFRRAKLSSASLFQAIAERTDFRESSLTEANCCNAQMRRANFRKATITGALFRKADLRGCTFEETIARGADFRGADLRNASFDNADLTGALFTDATLSGATLRGANLEASVLLRTDFEDANISGCHVHGVSAWQTTLTNCRQDNLVITAAGEPVITLDNLEMAQFIYLLLTNHKIRDVIDTLTSKVVLILGRFKPKRKAILDAIRTELRLRNYLPVLFDFDGPESRDVTETVTLLARMARFIIADLTDASSIPKELEAIAPSLAVPIQPLIENGSKPYSMFRDHWKYHWVLSPVSYADMDSLIHTMASAVLLPLEAKCEELTKARSDP